MSSEEALSTILRRAGLSDDVIIRFLNREPITDNAQAIRIIDAVRRHYEAEVVYEDEEGGLEDEPSYAILIRFRDLAILYFSSPDKCFIKIRNAATIDRDKSLLKKLLEKHRV